ncbi:uncharacterized protein EI90DRAFT_3132405 [Cantharellus anzutake]|uniref:uncharacterized protein n=1 Tax=Cantharellus anzutake TaxID=1750568 RepID=UPI001905AD1C|nr:uncharacterized protein EI90DRAFT_3132405 [Cantharellus anzutake]KAF8319553.1 hypothetical protein EI90DRAFT_3132405 [Cantharellus anzutake]
MQKGTIGVDFAKSTCARLAKFSYGPASTPSQANPCGNVPVKCSRCPKGSSAVWRYNQDAHYRAKHSPALPPMELAITNFEIEGLKVLWDNRHTANRMEVRRRKQRKPHFVISEAHSTRLALRTTDLEGSSAASSQMNSNVEDSLQQAHDTNPLPPDPLVPHPSPGPLLSANESIQTSLPAVHQSGRPMRLVQQLVTALHRCCDVEVTADEITNGSNVVRCPKPGCETVWFHRACQGLGSYIPQGGIVDPTILVEPPNVHANIDSPFLILPD